MKSKFQSVKGDKSRVNDHATYRAEVERIFKHRKWREDVMTAEELQEQTDYECEWRRGLEQT